MESNAEARFHVGEIVLHTLFDYRGVVYDIDPVFSLTDEWYEADGPLKAPARRALVSYSCGCRGDRPLHKALSI